MLSNWEVRQLDSSSIQQSRVRISRWLSANPASLIADDFGISDAEVARPPKKVLGFIR